MHFVALILWNVLHFVDKPTWARQIMAYKVWVRVHRVYSNGDGLNEYLTKIYKNAQQLAHTLQRFKNQIPVVKPWLNHGEIQVKIQKSPRHSLRSSLMCWTSCGLLWNLDLSGGESQPLRPEAARAMGSYGSS